MRVPGVNWLVELEKGVWLADIEGDPGRTIHRASATRFSTEHKAKRALRKARSYRPFEAARIYSEDITPFVGAYREN